MFRNTFQSGFLSILYSIGSKPLQIWDSKVKNGHIKRITDQDIQSSVLEIMGTNVSTSYIVCPADPKQTLGIKLPFLVMIIKNLKKYFTFEVQVLDDKGVKRRFRASNYQSTTRVKPFICTMPMRLDEGWNQIQFNLSDFTRRAYGTNYVETLRVQIHANCRIRRIYFSDRLYSEEELPPEFKLFIPTTPATRGDTRGDTRGESVAFDAVDAERDPAELEKVLTAGENIALEEGEMHLEINEEMPSEPTLPLPSAEEAEMAQREVAEVNEVVEENVESSNAEPQQQEEGAGNENLPPAIAVSS